MELAWGERGIPRFVGHFFNQRIRSQLGRLNSLQLRDWILELTTEYPDSVCNYRAMMLSLIVLRTVERVGLPLTLNP
ncbi:hypothetical protein N7467_004799 [Penicillium canescens]|nr:hypothetical protein N7467_004799 [Penicillium canescens]